MNKKEHKENERTMFWQDSNKRFSIIIAGYAIAGSIIGTLFGSLIFSIRGRIPDINEVLFLGLLLASLIFLIIVSVIALKKYWKNANEHYNRWKE